MLKRHEEDQRRIKRLEAHYGYSYDPAHPWYNDDKGYWCQKSKSRGRTSNYAFWKRAAKRKVRHDLNSGQFGNEHKHYDLWWTWL